MVVSLKERITIQLNVDKLFSSIDELLPIVRYLRITKDYETTFSLLRGAKINGNFLAYTLVKKADELRIDKLAYNPDGTLLYATPQPIQYQSMGMGTFPLSISTENRYSDITGPGPPSNQQSPQLTRLLSESTPVMDPVTLHRRDTELPI